MRGKVFEDWEQYNDLRITPAYAGKRPVWIAASRHGWDHPRLCGEKFQTLFCKIYIPGSPPPMRGKVHKMNHSDLCSRITPAYAGKSNSSGTRLNMN